jgi:putative proteasome-type protease
MTYCLGIILREGLVMASDSRSNASLDEVNVCQKMHTIVDPGECVLVSRQAGRP